LKTKFKLKYRPLTKILVWLGIYLFIVIFFGEFFYELKYGVSLNNSNIIFNIGVPFTIILILPSFIVAILYLKENQKMSFVVDKNQKIVEININSESKTYYLDQIESVIYNRQSYQKDFFWNDFSCYSHLGYIDLTFKNNDRYFLSCFLIDITKSPIFENAEIKYSFLPFIDRTDPKLIKEKTQKLKLKRIERLKQNFKSKSENELNKILENETKYQEEVLIAIREILKEKNVG
jgi:hypothetical protein